MGNLPAQAMGIVRDDVIKLDFSTAGDGDGGSLIDWNQVFNGNTLSSVKRQGGSVIDGVSISFTNLIAGRFNNDPASGNWAGTSADPFYIKGADDIYFHGSNNDLSVTFSGLDATLDYKVRIYSLINGQNTLDTFVVSDGAGFQSVSNTRNVRWNAATLEAGGTVFNDLQLNGSNQLVIRIQDEGSTFYPLNAIVVQAVGRTSVPEPSVSLLLSIGLLGMLGLKRKK
jgi:hypothetical protein